MRRLFFDESLFDDIITWFPSIAFFKADTFEILGDISDNAGFAAKHRAVLGLIKSWHVKIAEEFPGSDQIGKPALVTKVLARYGWIIDELRFDIFSKQFIIRQFIFDQFAIGQFVDCANSMNDNDFIETLIGLGVANG